MTDLHTAAPSASHLGPSAPATPEPPTAAASPACATLLSRLAALLGQAVPVHRFSMQLKTTGGVDLSTLELTQQAGEMWIGRFPGADVRTLSPEQLLPGHFPLLWVSRCGEQVLLLRGQLSSGALSAENPDGRTQELSASAAKAGQFLSLRPLPESTGTQHEGAPRTATEWFSHALRKHRRIFVEAMLATFIISAVGLTSSLYSMQVYDRVVPTKGYATLWVLTAGALMAIVLEFMMKQVRSHMVDRASKAIDMELSGVFFGKAMDIRMDARPATVGTFASQIRHFESVRQFMTTSTLFILADAPFAVFFVGVIALIAGPVAIVPMAMIPIGMLVGFLFLKPIERLSGANMRESNRKNGLLIEAIDGIESIKASAGEWKMLERYQAMSTSMADNELQLRALTSRGTNMAQVIQQLSYVGLIASGAYAITAGDLTMGGLIACSIISGRALAPMAQIPQLIIQWKNAQIALKALDAIMAMPSDREASQRLVVPETCEGLLRLDKVAFHYNPQQPVLTVPALEIRPGERIAVIGSVGSGKTTLIKLLSGLYHPREGQIFLDGVDVQHLAPEYVREHIGYLPQDVRLFNGTLRENLTLGLPTPSDATILAACQLTGLDLVVQTHPKGLELEISEGGRGLSGGQRQLVGLTRMLIARPKLLLLDEPTASMDAQLEATVMRHLFEEISPDSALVVVTHKPAVLPRVNRLIVVDRGRILLDGPREAVIDKLRQLQTGAPPRAPAPVRAGASTAQAPQVRPSPAATPSVRETSAT